MLGTFVVLAILFIAGCTYIDVSGDNNGIDSVNDGGVVEVEASQDVDADINADETKDSVQKPEGKNVTGE
ncbi:hypothetical protein DRH27_00515 [Candidatus Falkowbacteria bacterium]|nr:MAG: hypothetical protein DRH27_00515 [Candidatus Falkowbacteria bacterium]